MTRNIFLFVVVTLSWMMVLVRGNGMTLSRVDPQFILIDPPMSPIILNLTLSNACIDTNVTSMQPNGLKSVQLISQQDFLSFARCVVTNVNGGCSGSDTTLTCTVSKVDRPVMLTQLVSVNVTLNNGDATSLRDEMQLVTRTGFERVADFTGNQVNTDVIVNNVNTGDGTDAIGTFCGAQNPMIFFRWAFRTIESQVVQSFGPGRFSFFVQSASGNQQPCVFANDYAYLEVSVAKDPPNYKYYQVVTTLNVNVYRGGGTYTYESDGTPFRLRVRQLYGYLNTDNWRFDNFVAQGKNPLFANQINFSDVIWRIDDSLRASQITLTFTKWISLSDYKLAKPQLKLGSQIVSTNIVSCSVNGDQQIAINATMPSIEEGVFQDVQISYNGQQWVVLPSTQVWITKSRFAVINHPKVVLWMEQNLVNFELNHRAWTPAKSIGYALGQNLTVEYIAGATNVALKLPKSPNEQRGVQCHLCHDIKPIGAGANASVASVISAAKQTCANMPVTSYLSSILWAKENVHVVAKNAPCEYLLLGRINGSRWMEDGQAVLFSNFKNESVNALANHIWMNAATGLWSIEAPGSMHNVCVVCKHVNHPKHSFATNFSINILGDTGSGGWTPPTEVHVIDPVVGRLNVATSVPLASDEEDVVIHVNVPTKSDGFFGFILLLNSTSDNATAFVSHLKDVVPSQNQHDFKVDMASGGVLVVPTAVESGDYLIRLTGSMQKTPRYDVVWFEMRSNQPPQFNVNVTSVYPTSLSLQHVNLLEMHGGGFHAPLFLELEQPRTLFPVDVKNETFAIANVTLGTNTLQLGVHKLRLFFNTTQARQGVTDVNQRVLVYRPQNFLFREESFANDFDNATADYHELWANPSSVKASINTNCGAYSGSRAMVIGNNFRTAETVVFDLPDRKVRFQAWVRPGNSQNCDWPEDGDELFLQYNADGKGWVNLQKFSVAAPGYSSFGFNLTGMDKIQFRFHQPFFFSPVYDFWGVDNVRVDIPITKTIRTYEWNAQTGNTHSVEKTEFNAVVNVEGFDFQGAELLSLTYSLGSVVGVMHLSQNRRQLTANVTGLTTPGTRNLSISLNGGNLREDTGLTSLSFGVNASGLHPHTVWLDKLPSQLLASGSGFSTTESAHPMIRVNAIGASNSVTIVNDTLVSAVLNNAIPLNVAFGCNGGIVRDAVCYRSVASSCSTQHATQVSIFSEQENAFVRSASMNNCALNAIGLKKTSDGWRWKGTSQFPFANWRNATAAAVAPIGATASMNMTTGQWVVVDSATTACAQSCMNPYAFGSKTFGVQFSFMSQVHRFFEPTVLPLTVHQIVQGAFGSDTKIVMTASDPIRFIQMTIPPVTTALRFVHVECVRVGTRVMTGSCLNATVVPNAWEMLMSQSALNPNGFTVTLEVHLNRTALNATDRGFVVQSVLVEFIKFPVFNNGSAVRVIKSIEPRNVAANRPDLQLVLHGQFLNELNGPLVPMFLAQGTFHEICQAPLVVHPSGANGTCVKRTDLPAGSSLQLRLGFNQGLQVLPVEYTDQVFVNTYASLVGYNITISPEFMRAGVVSQLTIAFGAPVLSLASLGCCPPQPLVLIDDSTLLVNSTATLLQDLNTDNAKLVTEIRSPQDINGTVVLSVQVSLNAGATFLGNVSRGIAVIGVDDVAELSEGQSFFVFSNTEGQFINVTGSGFSTSDSFHLYSLGSQRTLCSSIAFVSPTLLQCKVKRQTIPLDKGSFSLVRNNLYESRQALTVDVINRWSGVTASTPSSGPLIPGRIALSFPGPNSIVPNNRVEALLTPGLRAAVYDPISAKWTEASIASRTSLSSPGAEIQVNILGDLINRITSRNQSLVTSIKIRLFSVDHPMIGMSVSDFVFQHYAVPTTFAFMGSSGPFDSRVARTISFSLPFAIANSVSDVMSVKMSARMQGSGLTRKFLVKVLSPTTMSLEYNGDVNWAGHVDIVLSVDDGLHWQISGPSLTFKLFSSTFAIGTSVQTWSEPGRPIFVYFGDANLDSLGTEFRLLEVGSNTVLCNNSRAVNSMGFTCDLTTDVRPGQLNVILAIGDWRFGTISSELLLFPFNPVGSNVRTLSTGFDIGDNPSWLNLYSNLKTSQCAFGSDVAVATIGTDRSIEVTDLTPGEINISFDLQASTGINSPCENPDTQEDIFAQLQCGQSNFWSTEKIYAPAEHRNGYVRHSLKLRSSLGCKFRLFQSRYSSSQIDNWRLDNLYIFNKDTTTTNLRQTDGGRNIELTVRYTIPTGLSLTPSDWKATVGGVEVAKTVGVTNSLTLISIKEKDLPTQIVGTNTTIFVQVLMMNRQMGLFEVDMSSPTTDPTDGGGAGGASSTKENPTTTSSNTPFFSRPESSLVFILPILCVGLVVFAIRRIESRLENNEEDENDVLGVELQPVSVSVVRNTDWSEFSGPEVVSQPYGISSSSIPSYSMATPVSMGSTSFGVHHATPIVVRPVLDDSHGLPTFDSLESADSQSFWEDLHGNGNVEVYRSWSSGNGNGDGNGNGNGKGEKKSAEVQVVMGQAVDEGEAPPDYADFADLPPQYQ